MNTMRAVDLNVTLEGFNFPHKVKAFVGMVNHYMVIKLVKRGGRRGGSTTLEIPIPLEGLLY
ncbi:MAG: hypothetical protein NTV48_00005, partial [Candidatus Vogelbacteria bacterium]|nr:hypothetical protein [Candidatus Vogelbacteria bacterium]